MKRRILCPTDFSKNAQNAIEYAVKLFKNETCVFYILNTYNAEPYTMELAIARDLEEFREKSIGGLRVILEWLSHDGYQGIMNSTLYPYVVIYWT